VSKYWFIDLSQNIFYCPLAVPESKIFFHPWYTYSFFNEGGLRAKRKSRIRVRKPCWELLNDFSAIPSKPFALVFDFSALLGDNLNWNIYILRTFLTQTLVYMHHWEENRTRTIASVNRPYSLVHTSNFVRDFVFLTDANEWTRTQKYRALFTVYFSVSHSLLRGGPLEKWWGGGGGKNKNRAEETEKKICAPKV
jgi:hypothetical protein